MDATDQSNSWIPAVSPEHTPVSRACCTDKRVALHHLRVQAWGLERARATLKWSRLLLDRRVAEAKQWGATDDEIASAIRSSRRTRRPPG